MALFRRPRFTRNRDGSYRVRLDATERALLTTLPDQLEALLTSGDSDGIAVRLYPPAYPTDVDRDAEYRRLMREELARRRIEALGVVRETLAAETLSGEELDAWVRVLNDVRLVLGTALDVSEADDMLEVDPATEDAAQRVLYYVLSGIVSDAVDALAGGLPPAAD